MIMIIHKITLYFGILTPHLPQKNFFMPRCVLLLTLQIPKIHFISDLASNVYFYSRQYLKKIRNTFKSRCGG